MFSKLLKYEMKAQGGIIGFLSLAALGAGLLGGLMMQLLLTVAESNADDTVLMLASVFSPMVIAGTVFAVIAYVIGVWILLMYRFYKHHFSDEGYLTFTLPVSTHQILLSSILNIAIWTLVSAIVAIISAVLIFLPVIAHTSSMLGDTSYDVMADTLSGYDVSILVMQIISMITSFIYGLILPLLSITIGAQVAKKHKLLAAFGIGYGLSTAISMVSGVLSMISFVGDFAISANSDTLVMVFSLLIPSVLYLAIGIGGYFIMHHLVDKKLNLT